MASKGSRAQGKLDEALKSYRDSLVIAKRLAASDRSNTGWQRDLSVLYNSIGDVLVAQGKLDEALKSYRDSLAIAERLAASDRSNTGWQRDIAVLYEGIGALEEHKRFVLGRETRQRDADRIRRFEEVQRRKRKWIKCGEIPVWISELGGSGPNEAARENAYTIVKEGLLARHFEENGRRSQVLFLFPGVSLTRRMTPQRLQDAIDNNYDNQHGRSWVENCWVPRNLFKRWCAWHHLPESPPRFQPSQEIRTPVSPEGAKRSPEPPMPAPTLVPQPASKLVVDTVDQPELPSGIEPREVRVPPPQDGGKPRSLLAHKDSPLTSGECSDLNTQPSKPSNKGGRSPTADGDAPKNTAKRRPQRERERARLALQALFGSEIPDAVALPNKHLAGQVNEWLRAPPHKMPPVGQRTIQRAAGRK
jgi:hypothetical protein